MAHVLHVYSGCDATSCAFRFGVPNFAALAQVRVVPGPVVAVVHVLTKQQVLGVELQGWQHNLRAAREQPAQATRKRERFGVPIPPATISALVQTAILWETCTACHAQARHAE